MSTTYPYEEIPVDWKRPPIDREIIRECSQRSDLKGFAQTFGALAILAATGTWAYLMYAQERWIWMAIALYVHGGVHAFGAATHELAHGTVFKTRWLNHLFAHVYGLIHWTGSSTRLYMQSHRYHHRYTLHKRSEGEEVHPRPQMSDTIWQVAAIPVDLSHLLVTLSNRIHFIFTPFLRNPRMSVWQRYCYANSSRKEQRAAYWTTVGYFLFHVVFATVAIATGYWFLVVVVSLPAFYGGKWYQRMIHATMHVGREPEVDDFRKCCRSVKINPIASLLYWRMEYHTEHHTYPGVPCYNLKKLHQKGGEHWQPRQTLREAWREMNAFSAKLLALSPAGGEDLETEPAG